MGWKHAKVCLKSSHNFAKINNVNFESLQVCETFWHWILELDEYIICEMDKLKT